MIATKQFAGKLGMIRKYDESMREVLSECLAYAMYQWHQGKNKNPHTELVKCLNEAGGFLSELAVKIPLGKRDASLGEHECERRADTTIAMLFMSREAKKAEAAAKRAERAERKAARAEQDAAAGGDAPDLGPKVEVPMLKSCVIDSDGNMIELSAEELHAAMAAVMALRIPALRAA